jgi:hypothetical protein
MLEFLFGLCGFLLELLAEAAFQFAVEYLFALALRGVAAALDTSEFKNPWLAGLGYLILGGVAGGLSLLVFSHPLLRPSRFHGISVVVSPLLTGLGMAIVGSALRKKNKKPLQIESFAYGFTFAFGMAVVRFFFVK